MAFSAKVGAAKGETRQAPIDLILAVTALVLVGFGLVMVYSASSPIALKKFSDPAHYTLRNSVYALVGIGMLAVASRLTLDQIRTFGRIGFWVCLGLLLLVLIPGIGLEGGGARRWINLRVATIQPSEPFKVMLVLYVAHLLASDPERVRRIKGGLLPLILVFAVAAAMLMAEPDFGATMMASTVLMGLVFVAGIPWSWIIALLMAAVPAAAAGVMMAPYRLRRVTSFMNPWDDPKDSDFQLVQSLLAFGNGGLKGVGLGEGWQKQFYLPESHTDFILAVIGEELGLFSVLALIALFALIAWRGFAVARASKDRFASLGAAGLTMLICAQALANMGVVMGLLPPKGLTLPFVSYGGTSLIVTMTAVGLLLAFSRTVPSGNRSKGSEGGRT